MHDSRLPDGTPARPPPKVAEETDLPLMCHHSLSSIPLAACPGRMRAGDVYTHCFNGSNVAIVDEGGALDPHVLSARARGVKFCVGHGQGAFNWNVAEAAAAQGFFPDSISTDLHMGESRWACRISRSHAHIRVAGGRR